MRSDDPAAAHVMELIDGFWPIHVMAAMAQLEVPEALAGGPASAGELAQRLGLDEYQLFRLLRASSALGLCEDLGDRRFALTDAGTLLRGDAAGSQRGDVLFYAGQSRGIFTHIPEIVRTGRVERAIPTGPEGSRRMNQDPAQLDATHRTMVGSSRDVAIDLVRIYDFNAHKTLVDVGGGYGGLLCEVLKAYPHLTGKVFDQPHVERGALAYQESQGLQDRAGYVPGSFFDGPPPPADCYLMKYILHDWEDEHSRQILANCRLGMGSGGVLLLIDRLLPERFAVNPDHRRFARHDMAMMGYGGKERTEREMFALLESVGLRPARIVGQAWKLSVIEVRTR